jgi:hypothetical protein
VDHINGGGRKQWKSFQSGEGYYRKILQDINAGSTDYQLLCANCNWIKKHERNEV